MAPLTPASSSFSCAVHNCSLGERVSPIATTTRALIIRTSANGRLVVYTFPMPDTTPFHFPPLCRTRVDCLPTRHVRAPHADSLQSFSRLIDVEFYCRQFLRKRTLDKVTTSTRDRTKMNPE